MSNGLKKKCLRHGTLHKKMKFSVEAFLSKCDQIRRKLRSWSLLLKKSLMENYIFYALIVCVYMLVKPWRRLENLTLDTSDEVREELGIVL